MPPPKLILSALLVVQAAAYYGLAHRPETAPLSQPLSDFPAAISDWRMVREGVIEQDERDVLRADDYLTRQYATPAGKSANLFVAYFQSIAARRADAAFSQELPAGCGLDLVCGRHDSHRHRRARAAN
jgi:hypothetical protein